jgi:hypothetical protein
LGVRHGAARGDELPVQGQRHGTGAVPRGKRRRSEISGGLSWNIGDGEIQVVGLHVWASGVTGDCPHQDSQSGPRVAVLCGCPHRVASVCDQVGAFVFTMKSQE